MEENSKQNLYKVIICEAKTGVVLHKDGRRWNRHETKWDYYFYFKTKEEAFNFIKENEVAGGEYNVFDPSGNVIKNYVSDLEPTIEIVEVKKQWWKFWKH